MGIAVATLTAIGLGLDIGGTVLSISAQEAAQQQREIALETRIRENKISANNKALQRGKMIERTISQEEADIGTRGLAPGSASFKAIEENSFNNWAADQKADDLSLEFEQDELRNKQEEFSEETNFNLVNDVFEGAKGVISTELGGMGANKNASDPFAHSTVRRDPFAENAKNPFDEGGL